MKTFSSVLSAIFTILSALCFVFCFSIDTEQDSWFMYMGLAFLGFIISIALSALAGNLYKLAGSVVAFVSVIAASIEMKRHPNSRRTTALISTYTNRRNQFNYSKLYHNAKQVYLKGIR